MKPALSRFVLSMLAAALPATPCAAEAAPADRGLTFVKANCAICHAIGRYDESPLPVAPPLRTLHNRYAIEELEEAFAEGIVTGHPSMPQFQLDPAQISDLVAYLRTLE